MIQIDTEPEQLPERQRLDLIRVGNLGQLEYPALLPYDDSYPWLVFRDAVSLPLAAELGEGVALQLLGQHKIGQAQVFLFEAAPTPHFAQLKRLLAVSEHQWGVQFFTARDCLQKLAELEELVHRRFALLAQAGAAEIYAYNAEAARAEPLIYLLINGIDNALSEPLSLQQLGSLCGQGPAVGVVPILLLDCDSQLKPQLAESRRQALQSFQQDIRSQALGLEMCGDLVRPLNIPDEAWSLLQRFDLQMGLGDLCQAWCDELLITEDEEDRHGERDFLNIQLGLAGATTTCFCMGEKSDVYHAMIGGATRTGKTTLLNNLILNACETYSPDELQLSLMDFKDGVSFWEYDGLNHVAGLYAPVEDDIDAALECLERFEQQINLRNARFRTQRVTRLADFNRVVEKQEALPRCLLVIDEVQSLFEGRDYQQKNAVKQILSTVAKKGAAAGVHMIICTQSFQNVELEGDVKDQIHLRIGLRHASSMGCRALMGRDNDAMLELPRFTAIYNSQQGEPRHNRTVTLDDLPDFHARLDALKEKYPRVLGDTPGSETAQLELETNGMKTRFSDGDVSGEW